MVWWKQANGETPIQYISFKNEASHHMQHTASRVIVHRWMSGPPARIQMVSTVSHSGKSFQLGMVPSNDVKSDVTSHRNVFLSHSYQLFHLKVKLSSSAKYSSVSTKLSHQIEFGHIHYRALQDIHYDV